MSVIVSFSILMGVCSCVLLRLSAVMFLLLYSGLSCKTDIDLNETLMEKIIHLQKAYKNTMQNVLDVSIPLRLYGSHEII